MEPYDMSEKGLRDRWANNKRRIHPPPRTPCSNPLEMPFSKLRLRNVTGTMTLDEELLRALVGQFTIRSVTALPFREIFETLKRESPHLTYALFDDPDYLWSYIRCYPEHFAIDCDPRYPNNVWYTSKCKLVAKADRRRYQREWESGNIPATSYKPIEYEWDQVRYDEKLEHQSLIRIYAVFKQIESRFEKSTSYSPHLPTKFIRQALKKGALPNDISAYIGENVEDYLQHRMHVFNIFGGQVSLRRTSYVDTIRTLTETLHRNGGRYDLRKFFEYFRSSPYLGQSGARTIFNDPKEYHYDGFLLFLNSHKLLFRLRPRDSLIQLRHSVVPAIQVKDIDKVPAYEIIETVESFEDLERLGQDNQNDNPWENGAYGGFSMGFRSEHRSPVPAPSAYTVQWLTQNFSDMGTSDIDDDGGIVECGDSWRRPVQKSLHSSEIYGCTALTKTQNVRKGRRGEGWPTLAPRGPNSNDKHSLASSSSVSTRKRFGGGQSEAEYCEWNGCF